MRQTLTGVPEGLAPVVLARLAEEERGATPPLLLHVARDDRRLEALAEGLAFFAPKVRVIQVPAWDTVPYDRIGPNAEIVATRVAALARLAAAPRKGPTVVLTTVNAILQRLPPREFIRRSLKNIAPGQRLDMAELVQRLNLAGFLRTGTVMEPGEYAVRGGILDLFPPGRSSPVRLDFFGDTLEHIKAFDPETQRTGKIVQKLTLMPISEVAFGGEAEKRFRRGYVEAFGPAPSEDPLYEAVSAGQRYAGMEHWLPLFHERLETLFDYVGSAPVSFDHLAEQAVGERLALVADHYEARVKGLESQTFGAPPYKPVPAAAMFLTREEWDDPAGRPQRAPHDAVRGGRRCGPRPGALVRRPGRAQFRPRAVGRRGPQRVRRHGSPRARPARPGQARDPRCLHSRRARAAGDAAGRARAARYPQDR